MRRGVFVPREHVLVCDGDWASAALLSQVIYWFAPAKGGSPTKATIQRGGAYWIAKSNVDFFDELGLTRRQVDRTVSFLVKLGLLQTEIRRFDGAPTRHITVHWPTFFQRLDEVSNA